MKFLTAAITAGLALSVVSVAEARDGCGRGFHRIPNGRCVPNLGPGPVVLTPGLVIGRFYEGHGYWDGRRYWERHEWGRRPLRHLW